MANALPSDGMDFDVEWPKLMREGCLVFRKWGVMIPLGTSPPDMISLAKQNAPAVLAKERNSLNRASPTLLVLIVLVSMHSHTSMTVYLEMVGHG